MKAIFPLLTAALLVCAPQVKADRDSDFWLPENMAKNECTSVHLAYGPKEDTHTAAYQEMVVEKSAPGTYFACNNFTTGYIGVQQLTGFYKDGAPVRVAIFSVWDAKDSGDNPHAAPESERAKLIQRGDKVMTDRFGGEGTGGKSMRLFDWKEGDVIRTLVVEKPDGEDFRQITGYIFDPETQKWELMSSWRVQALRRGLGGGCGFVEDFRRNGESRNHERRATFGPALRYVNGEWKPATLFRMTKDANPNMNINCRFNPERGYFSLATGGAIEENPAFRVFEEHELPQQPAPVSVDPEVQKLADAPLLPCLEQEPYVEPRWQEADDEDEE